MPGSTRGSDLVDVVAQRGLEPDLLIDEVEGLIVPSASPTRLAVRRYRRHRAAMVSTVALLVIAVACIAAPVIADVLNIVLPGLGIPLVVFGLAIFMFWFGLTSWRRNAALGLHRRAPRTDEA